MRYSHTVEATKRTEGVQGPLLLASTVVVGDGRAASARPRIRSARATPGPPRPTDYSEERERRTIRQAMRIGLWVWPSFALLDAYMCFVLYPGAPFALFVVYRLAVEGFFWFVYREARREGVSIVSLGRLQHAAFFLAALGIALMAVHLGGLRSVYMHGISLVCLVHAALKPEHWRRSLAIFLPIGLAFPVVMAVAALLSASERAEWLNLRSLAVFASNYVFVAASSLVGMISGHAVWTARQQVYRARQLGRYRLQAPIGTGGMGQVWLAWDGVLRRNVALKLLQIGENSTPDLLRRFEREARAASRLKGPNTAQIYDFGASDDGIYYMAMEYLAGTDLHALVRAHGPLPPARAIAITIQACLSLEEAHEAGIIHRDVKPQNLFVIPIGEDQELVKLLDFGIARFHALDASAQLTHDGLMLGTPTFMAPELWQGARADERSDIYALGATLYFLLVGAPPFESDLVRDLMRAHVGRQPAPPSDRRGGPLPPALDAIVLRCLEKSPEKRFQSARELRAALAAVRVRRGWTPAHVRAFWQARRAAMARKTPEPEAERARI